MNTSVSASRVAGAVSVFVSLVVCLFLSSCASKQIDQLQTSVVTLESRLQQYQQDTVKDSEFTAETLGELQESITNAFQEIRFRQGNLEKQVEQLSVRLATVEQDSERLQTQAQTLDSRTSDNYSTFMEGINQSRTDSAQALQESMASVNQTLQSLRNEVAQLKQQDSQTASRIQAVQSQLEQQLSTLEQENRDLLARILKEVGAQVPEPATRDPRQPTADPVTAGVHTVESGDTLSGIAAKYNVNVTDLQQLNGIEDPSKIYRGQKLRIP